MTESGDNADLLAQQLARTRALWHSIEVRGVREGTELTLDFSFEAPSLSRASALCELLRRETDYSVDVSAHEDEWTVSGHTQRAAISLAILEQWVDWMVAAGEQTGAIFDGWGTELP
jgi:hypothetical protein